MQLIKWNPMSNEDDEFFNLPMVRPNNTPSLDIYQDQDNVYARVALPGVDSENIKVSIENSVLTLESSTEKKSEIDEKDYYRKEIRYGSFRRNVQLPTHVQGDKAIAEYEDGILNITVPKKKEEKTKKIEVKINLPAGRQGKK
ncbi:Hsp20/alpha crystallin family protein [bacterium]|nr:Hsp20/alpha crystallin family protein [bacterium]